MTEWLLVVGAMRNQIVAQDPVSESLHRKSTRLLSDDDDDDDDTSSQECARPVP